MSATATTQRLPEPAASHRGRRPSRRDNWWPDAIAGSGILSIVIVVALWVHGANLQALSHGAPDAFNSLGRLAGLVAADLLLIQVLLMARVPWIERTYGQDRLAHAHRLFGFTSFNLMLAHIVLITVGYAGASRSGLIGEAWDLVTTYPGMLLATAATAAIVMVTVTSVRAARAKLRYESWHLLHLYAYLGVALALPHELWTGADFVGTPVARAYWWALYIATAGCVLLFRIGQPLWRTWRYRLRVDSVVPETPGVTSVYLSGRDLDRLPVSAGQFFNWRFLGRQGWTRAQPYSLSAAPRPGMLRITVKDLGDGSRTVADLRRGTRVMIEGPYGRLTGASRRHHYVTFIASGIGITPLRALIESESFRPGDATLLYRASRPEDFTFRGELDWFARARGVTVHYLAGKRGRPDSWLPAGYTDDQRTLAWLTPRVARGDVFVCGPQTWMDSVMRSLVAAGVPEDHIHFERFGW